MRHRDGRRCHSLRNRSGLSPAATIRAPAVSGPRPGRVMRSGAVASTSGRSTASSSAISTSRSWILLANDRMASFVALATSVRPLGRNPAALSTSRQALRPRRSPRISSGVALPQPLVSVGPALGPGSAAVAARPPRPRLRTPTPTPSSRPSGAGGPGLHRGQPLLVLLPRRPAPLRALLRPATGRRGRAGRAHVGSDAHERLPRTGAVPPERRAFEVRPRRRGGGKRGSRGSWARCSTRPPPPACRAC
jgi:hypothetical protein